MIVVLADAEDVIEHWTSFISASSDTRKPSFPEPTNLLPEAEVPGADVDNKLIYKTFSILCFIVVFWQEINFLFLVYIIGRAYNYSTDRSPTTLTFCFFFDWHRDTRLFHRPCHGFQLWLLWYHVLPRSQQHGQLAKYFSTIVYFYLSNLPYSSGCLSCAA